MFVIYHPRCRCIPMVKKESRDIKVTRNIVFIAALHIVVCGAALIYGLIT